MSKTPELPDLDDAPDIYETPELTDDKTSTVRSNSLTSEGTLDNTSDGLDRTRLRPQQARTHFLPSRVDARQADFSDRLNERRQAYNTSTRTRHTDGRVIEAEDQDDNEWSDDEPAETLARKLARLTREVDEVKAECARLRAEGSELADDNKLHENGIEALTATLESVRLSQREAGSAHRRLAARLDTRPITPKPAVKRAATSPRRPAEDNDTLWSEIAYFDTRLTELETALGLGALDPSDASGVTPILPTLSVLDKQTSFLTSKDTRPYLEQLAREIPTQHDDTKGDDDDDELAPALRSLASLLPTLTAQTPLLPALVDRLSSLRHMHAGAETASALLDELERKTRDNEVEIRLWRDGLAKVVEAVEAAEKGNRNNVQIVDEWVRDIEGRVKGVLGGS